MEPQAAGAEVETLPDFALLFDSLPCLIMVLDVDLHIRAVNQAYARATLIEKDLVVGKELFDVFPDNPEDQKADGVRNLSYSLKQVLSTRLADTMAIQRYDIRTLEGRFETRFWSCINAPVLDPQGNVRWIVHRAEDVTELVNLKAHWESQNQLARDLTSAVRSLRLANSELATTLADKEDLAREHAYLASIVESSGSAIVAIDLDGRISSWNSAAERLFGYSAAEILQQPVSLLFPPSQTGTEEQVARRALAGELITQYETCRLHKDGRPIDIALTASPILDREGRIAGASAIMRDITTEKRLKSRADILQSELAHVDRLGAMGEMSAAIAHELNQPLAAIVNYGNAASRLLAGEEPNGQILSTVRETVDKLVVQALRAGSIIKALRAYVEKRVFAKTPQNLNDVIREAVSFAMVGQKTGNLKLALELDPAIGSIDIDKIQIQQVLLNLVRNAVEAMASQEKARLRVSSSAGPGKVEIIVRDNGPGISAEISDRLFHHFVTNKPNGMGIGLKICRSIIEAHGGTLTASDIEEGAEFVITLPRGEPKSV